MTNEHKISSSELAAFKKCRRSWYYNYIWHRQPRPSDALLLGSAVHKQLEDYYTIGADPENDKAGTVVAGWLESDLAEQFKQLVGDLNKCLFETTLEQQFLDGITLRGLADVYSPDANVLLDWKTSKKVWSPSDLWRSDQLRNYALMIREMCGQSPTVFVVNLRTVSPNHAASKPPFYQIIGLPEQAAEAGRFPDTLLDAHAKRIGKELAELAETKTRGLAGNRVDQPHFTRFCDTCAYSSACEAADISDTVKEWARLTVSTSAVDANKRYNNTPNEVTK